MILAPLSDKIRLLEEELKTIVPGSCPALGPLVGNAGKMRRGKLILILGELLGSPEGITTAAAAGEAIHLATLVHDDVLDQGQTRRGEPSLFQELGSSKAILYGDLIFSRAVLAINRLENWGLSNLLLDTIENLCSGELLADSLSRRFPWTKDAYLEIARLKTSSLFEYSCLSAGLLARIPPRQMEVLKRFGTNLGICYQIADDCLDFAESPDQTGKDSLSDLRNGVPNLILVLAGEDPSLEDKLGQAISIPTKPGQLREISFQIREAGFTLKALSEARAYLEKSRRDCENIKKWGYTGNPELIDQYIKEQSELLDKLEKL